MKGTIMRRSKRYGLGNFVLDALMLTLTAGVWIVWIIIRELQNFTSN